MKIVAYLPLFGDVRVDPRVFKSFVEMLMEPVEGYKVEPFIHTVGPSLDYNRNDSIDRILGTHDPEFIMCCDADNVQPRKVISKLLAGMTDEIGIVSGIYFKKSFPYSCVQGTYLPWDEHLEKKHFSLKEGGFIAPGEVQTLFYRPLQYFDVVRPIDVFGMGCVLIRASIFKSLKQPYFKYVNPYLTGDYSLGMATEDMHFCSEMKKAGIKVLCNPKVVAGHIVSRVIQGPEVEE